MGGRSSCAIRAPRGVGRRILARRIVLRVQRIATHRTYQELGFWVALELIRRLRVSDRKHVSGDASSREGAHKDTRTACSHPGSIFTPLYYTPRGRVLATCAVSCQVATPGAFGA